MATAATTKANGIVEVQIDQNGSATAVYTPSEGIVDQLLDSVTTLFSTQKVCVGNAALIQRFALSLTGNAIATHSSTGKFGVSALGKSFVVGA